MSFSYICVFLQASALLHLWPAAGIFDPRVVWWELPAFSATELDQRHILRQQWLSLVYKNLPAEAQNWSPDRLGSEWQSRLSAACLTDKWNTQVNKYLSFSCGEHSVLCCGLCGSSIRAGNNNRLKKLIRKAGSVSQLSPSTTLYICLTNDCLPDNI